MRLTEAAGRLNSASGSDLPALLFLTDHNRVPDPVAVARTLPAGSGVILRDYDDANRSDLAARLAAVAGERNLTLLVGNDLDLARAVGADGVHYPEGVLPTARPDGLTRPMLMTTAAHSAAALERAAAAGADAALLSPIFSTASHPETLPLGLRQFSALAASTPLPIYALGGVTNANAHQLLLSGAVGIAAIGALAELDRPEG